MKIVVIGGSGLIGQKLCPLLREKGHEVVAASPSSGVNTITGEGVAEVLVGADVVVDVTNSPSFADADVLAFFEASTRTLLREETKAGVGHHVAVSIVGTDRVPDSGYLRAKLAQEALIKGGGVPYTILRATQFFEFVGAIVGASAQGDTVRLPPSHLQPLAADDVVAALLERVLEAPENRTFEVAGPERIGLDALARMYVKAKRDAHVIVTDPDATYFGAKLTNDSLTAGEGARIGAIRFEDWLRA